MGWRIGLSERADLDLGQVVAFPARKNPAAAERLGLKLVYTIFSLQEMPHRGVEVRGRPGYRRILHRPWFLIFYRINEERHSEGIVRVWDARQDPAMFAVD
jgi:plasmid stabilization system protein ParE